MSKITLIHSDNQHVEPASEAGVNGYQSKEAAGNGFLRAIRKTRKEIAFLNVRVSKSRRKHSPHSHRNNGCVATLTRRQSEVIRLIADGYSTKNIAGFLRLSTKTVEKHRQALMKKLGIHNIAMLTRYAVSSGIVPSNWAQAARGQV